MERQDIALKIVLQELQVADLSKKIQARKIATYLAFQISRFILMAKRLH